MHVSITPNGLCRATPRARLWCTAILALAGLLCTSGCDDACLELAKRICSCETSTANRKQCEVRVDDAAGSHSTSTAELERCSLSLDTCTCESLADGDLEACGLAN